ncbi:MAG TPA: hypothetical protein VFZ09_07665 [Archangium sp.]|uniref:hypothetical protein n=1 Tax=Archangium sp. TaxID=1872627 RepID=UPI002E3372F3|nr:hypothetical protein [Archangium sp.]HEX5746105.1 hypothetical protein [Archangium sp.]
MAPLTPVQSFQHTLREISVNRANPCELVRELISNSYDAGANRILVFPLIQKKGLLFFDNGKGLSEAEKDKLNDIEPYRAFFSIGKGTKTKGEQIGYKCQGSKLCFASRRFSVITRCADEKKWRWKTVDNPKTTLDITYDLTATQTETPWLVLRDQILVDADERTSAILEALGEDFFRTEFTQGTMLVVEDFEVDNHAEYFSVKEPEVNYLYNYIRFFTAHGDVRRIDTKEHGFRPSDVKAVRSSLKSVKACGMEIWIVDDKTGKGALREIPLGWPYLPPQDKGEEPPEQPQVVKALRKGRFLARYATAFKHEDRTYQIIFAIDGHRRALEKYKSLGRQSKSGSGIKLSEVRGVLLASNGIVVCPYPALLDHTSMRDFSILQEGMEHFVFIINGNFELVTNRDALAPSSLQVLRDVKFVEQVRTFIQQLRQQKEGDVLAQLMDRLNRETTRHKEDQYINNNNRLRDELRERETFVIKGIPALETRPFFAPETGEEHFVGALYTMFAHLVEQGNPASKFWSRPLTFAGLGIDALALKDEGGQYRNGNLLCVEYKYAFSKDDEFNHPLNITDRIVCWDLKYPEIGELVADIYNYEGVVKSKIQIKGQDVGFSVSDVRHRNELKELEHEVMVLSLRALINATFDVKWRPGSKPVPAAQSKKKTAS